MRRFRHRAAASLLRSLLTRLRSSSSGLNFSLLLGLRPPPLRLDFSWTGGDAVAPPLECREPSLPLLPTLPPLLPQCTVIICICCC
uniref:Uncharacterized protein n=1 Tax=Ixodes ricinus TaxID=34613 RepID=A0A6B0U9I1_IXORI